MSTSTTEETKLEHFHELAKHFTNCMMTSHGTEGKFHSRPMRVVKISDGESFWFITHHDSPKMKELSTNQECCLTFQDKSSYLAVEGMAEFLTDKATIKSLWSEAMRPWFPDGPESEGIAVIKVHPVSGEFWDFSGVMKKLKFMFSTGKAYLSHHKVDYSGLEEHNKVSFQEAQQHQ